MQIVMPLRPLPTPSGPMALPLPAVQLMKCARTRGSWRSAAGYAQVDPSSESSGLGAGRDPRARPAPLQLQGRDTAPAERPTDVGHVQVRRKPRSGKLPSAQAVPRAAVPAALRDARGRLDRDSERTPD